MTLLLGCVLCRLTDLGGWILVGVSSSISDVPMLVERFREAVSFSKAECFAFLLDVAEASGISTSTKFLLVEDQWRGKELQSNASRTALELVGVI
ncbi:hypothetical protein V6N13_042757 [Hibiscus sabdariffa]